jgi:hypothetical protein
MFWFHCGRCGSLFQSQTGDVKGRLCTKCGADPSLGLVESPLAGVIIGGETPSDAASESEHPGYGGRPSGKDHHPRHLMLKIVGGWLLVLVVIVLAVRLLLHEDESGRQSAPPPSASMNEDNLLLNNTLPTCTGVFSGFLAAGTPEERNQFVLTPVSTALRMARYYSLNSLANIDPATLTLRGSAVFNLPGGKTIETHWDTQNGKTLDAVFREENNEWRLDWEDFARYSDYPWPLFLAGSGDPVGEFRLLARERLANERKDAQTISVVLYAPRFGRPNDTGFQSPEFLVSRNTRNGQLLDAAFKLARQRERVFKAKLPDLNPEGMIRVRVKIQRSEVNMERLFEILEVLACHWYAVDDPGVEPLAPPEAKPQEP